MNADRARFATSAAGSLLLHGLLLTPLTVAAMTSSPALQPLETPRELLQTDEPPLPAEDDIALGLESSKTASVSWIGYDSYLEHLAQLGETDQAAFTRTDESGAPVRAQPSIESPAGVAQPFEVAAAPPTPPLPEEDIPEPFDPAPPPLPDPVAPTLPEEPPEVAHVPEPGESPAESFASPEPELPSEDAVAVALSPEIAEASEVSDPLDRPMPEPGENPELPSPPPPAATLQAPSLSELLQQIAQQAREALEAMTSAAEPQNDPPGNPPASRPAIQPAPQTPPTPPTSGAAAQGPPAPGTAQPGPSEAGERSERESDPTSVVNVPPESWKLGRPLAAHGLEIITRRPQFTELMRATASPRNPICEIRFDRTGTAVKASLLLSSGERGIDDAIVNALYGWKAKGERLQKLKGKDTAAVRIRMILID